jgi:hypothetical protein
MKLYKLSPLTQLMKENDNTYTLFRFQKNKVDFDVFYDIGIKPYRLVIVQLLSQLCIRSDVMKVRT